MTPRLTSPRRHLSRRTRRPRRAWSGWLAPLLVLATMSTAGCSKSESGPAAPRAAVTPVDAATAGSIQVQVSYSGSPPTPATINMNGTPACAAMHESAARDQSLVVTNGRLAGAVVYIKSGLGDRAFAPR